MEEYEMLAQMKKLYCQSMGMRKDLEDLLKQQAEPFQQLFVQRIKNLFTDFLTQVEEQIDLADQRYKEEAYASLLDNVNYRFFRYRDLSNGTSSD